MGRCVFQHIRRLVQESASQSLGRLTPDLKASWPWFNDTKTRTFQSVRSVTAFAGFLVPLCSHTSKLTRGPVEMKKMDRETALTVVRHGRMDQYDILPRTARSDSALFLASGSREG